MAEVSWYSRLEPRPRENDLTKNLAAEIRDPLWFLSRQWQMGEFEGEDTGSLAYVQYSMSTSRMPRWRKGPNEPTIDIDPGAPLEPQTLREPFEPDLSLRVELSQDFSDFLLARVGNATGRDAVLTAFAALPDYGFQQPDDSNELSPVDPATKRFLLVCATGSLDGYALYTLGLAVAGGGNLPGGLPASIRNNATLVGQIEAALGDLVERATAVFGEIGTVDPRTWNAPRLEYRLQVFGADPSGVGNATLDAHPDSDGEYEWFSFDVVGKNPTASEAAPNTQTHVMIPAHVEFDGMPATRFWNFEENTLALPDVASETDELVKLIATDFMLVHANDWYVLPHSMPVGSLAKVNHLVVRDVFGQLMVVKRADAENPVAGLDRWTMFSITDASVAPERLADYFVLPPSSGAAMQLGAVLEDVRFGRDEMANMAFGVERVTTSLIGEPRSGRERDAEIDARVNPPPLPEADNDFPLRYRIESEVPANWIPLFPVHKFPNTNNPSVQLEKGAALRNTSTTPQPVQALGSILNPEPGGSSYRIEEEELPRSGLRVQRVVYRTRWTDGTTHLWVQRRRQIGAGESQSGLEFDQALPKRGVDT